MQIQWLKYFLKTWKLEVDTLHSSISNMSLPPFKKAIAKTK